MEAAEEGSGSLPYRMVQLARLHVLPSTIFVSSKAPEALIQVLRSPLGLGAQLPEQGTEGTHAPDTATGTAEKCEVRFERAKLFTADAARECLASVHVFGMPQGLSTRDRVHIVNTMVSLSREQQVCAAGALLSVLSRDGILAQPAGSGSTVSLHLEFMGEASLEGHLLVDPGSLEALGIFRLEDHPSAMGLGRAKEGLSVFGMLNRCVSPPGKRLLRLWFARPLVDAAALEQRLDGVHALAARPDEAKALKSLVRAVHDPMRLLARLQCLQSLPAVRDLMSLQESLAALLRIR